jgi:hypothetical protein
MPVGLLLAAAAAATVTEKLAPDAADVVTFARAISWERYLPRLK